MTNTTQEKLDEILKDLPPDKREKLNNELYDFMCRSIIVLLQDFVEGPGISEQQIEVARQFAELKPDTEAAKELLEFLVSKDVQRALIKDAPE
jgi:hypothetical protein